MFIVRYVVKVSVFRFLQFFIWILELFRQCGICVCFCCSFDYVSPIWWKVTLLIYILPQSQLDIMFVLFCFLVFVNWIELINYCFSMSKIVYIDRCFTYIQHGYSKIRGVESAFPPLFLEENVSMGAKSYQKGRAKRLRLKLNGRFYFCFSVLKAWKLPSFSTFCIISWSLPPHFPFHLQRLPYLHFQIHL